MEHTSTHVFAAPIDQVWAMFSDPDSHVAKFTGMGHRELEVKHTERTDDQLKITISRLVDVDLPGFARKVLKPTNTVISEDTWNRLGDGTLKGHYDLDTVGAPVDVSGDTECHPDPDDPGRTIYTVTVSLKVNVPLIGGKIANWAKGNLEQQVNDEFAAGDAWLADHPA